MVKYLIMAFILLAAPCSLAAPKAGTNYDKIISRWNSHVTKRTHNIKQGRDVQKGLKKNNNSTLLEQWKTEVRKVISGKNKAFITFTQKARP